MPNCAVPHTFDAEWIWHSWAHTIRNWMNKWISQTIPSKPCYCLDIGFLFLFGTRNHLENCKFKLTLSNWTWIVRNGLIEPQSHLMLLPMQSNVKYSAPRACVRLEDLLSTASDGVDLNKCGEVKWNEIVKYWLEWKSIKIEVNFQRMHLVGASWW